jgi:HK97 family phage major capsid protein
VFEEEEQVINGIGVGQPLGVLQGPNLNTILRETAAYVSAVDIGNMWKSRWTAVNDYVWLVNPTVLGEIYRLTFTSTYFPAFMPPGGLSGLPYATLFGRPMIETEHCQAFGTAGDIILASMSQYQTIRKGGVQAASSIHVYFLTDDVAYRFIDRIDGQPKASSTITPIHGDAVSPFVVLKSTSS